MTYKEIETRLLNLERAFLQSQNNNIKVTDKSLISKIKSWR